MSQMPPPPVGPLTQELPREITGFPFWIKACGALVLLLFVVSAIRIGPVFSAAIAVERAQRHLAGGENATAARELAPVVSKYPAAVDLRLDLAQAQLMSGDLQGVVDTLQPLAGKEISKEQADREDQLVESLKQKAGKAPK